MFKNKKLGRQLTAVLLSLSMLLTLIPGNLFAAQTTDSNSADALDVEADQVKAEKTLIDNGDGTYTITLGIQGKPLEKPEDANADVVLVVDNSVSMRESTGNNETQCNGTEFEEDFFKTYYICKKCGAEYDKKLYPSGPPEKCTHVTNPRLEVAKKVGVEFAENLLNEGNNRLAVVSFAGNYGGIKDGIKRNGTCGLKNRNE